MFILFTHIYVCLYVCVYECVVIITYPNPFLHGSHCKNPSGSMSSPRLGTVQDLPPSYPPELDEPSVFSIATRRLLKHYLGIGQGLMSHLSIHVFVLGDLHFLTASNPIQTIKFLIWID